MTEIFNPFLPLLNAKYRLCTTKGDVIVTKPSALAEFLLALELPFQYM